MAFIVNRQKHLVHVPLIPQAWTLAPELIGICLAKLAAPLPNGFVGHRDTACKQELFATPIAQAKSQYSQTLWLIISTESDDSCKG
jgi:hypothetical protein